MARDDIKIIEFGMGDDVDGNAPAQSESSIRILEFDEPAGTASPTAVSGEDVGPIKIIEFDDDRGGRPPADRPNADLPPATRRTVKIVEFDDDGNERRKSGVDPKMKILEFD